MDLSTEESAELESLKTELAKKNEFIERLKKALFESGKQQVYIDGYEAALSTVNSIYVNVWWGPEATPNNGLDHMKKVVVEALEDNLSVMKTGKRLPRYQETPIEMIDE